MTYIIPKQLKEEYKILDKPRIWWKDCVTFAVLFGIFLLFKIFVHSWLQIPYWITAVVSSFFLVQPAAGNPKKRNWEAILLMINKDRFTHYSINHVNDLR
ncbi:MAG TPA: hypothetical protein DHW78_10535 [Ruminococcaceae bacterium]|nr:hypothetical protein [Oscillospiraceae bacterium]HCM24744.1 hypothetical protein [Oscillospiraceae bacterium]